MTPHLGQAGNVPCVACHAQIVSGRRLIQGLEVVHLGVVELLAVELKLGEEVFFIPAH